jgi:hypothetical protein
MTHRTQPAWLPLVAICLGYFLVILDVTVINVAIPAIGTGLHAGVTALQWVVDGYTVAFAALLLFCGGLSDRLGGKRVFLAGLVVFTLASAGCGRRRANRRAGHPRSGHRRARRGRHRRCRLPSRRHGNHCLPAPAPVGPRLTAAAPPPAWARSRGCDNQTALSASLSQRRGMAKTRMRAKTRCGQTTRVRTKMLRERTGVNLIARH